MDMQLIEKLIHLIEELLQQMQGSSSAG